MGKQKSVCNMGLVKITNFNHWRMRNRDINETTITETTPDNIDTDLKRVDK